MSNNIKKEKPDPKNENITSTEAYHAVQNNLWSLEDFETYLREIEELVKYGCN